jgi:hypothetical protein
VEGIANKGGSSQTGLEVMIHGGTLEEFEQSKANLFVQYPQMPHPLIVHFAQRFKTTAERTLRTG